MWIALLVLSAFAAESDDTCARVEVLTGEEARVAYGAVDRADLVPVGRRAARRGPRVPVEGDVVTAEVSREADTRVARR